MAPSEVLAGRSSGPSSDCSEVWLSRGRGRWWTTRGNAMSTMRCAGCSSGSTRSSGVAARRRPQAEPAPSPAAPAAPELAAAPAPAITVAEAWAAEMAGGVGWLPHRPPANRAQSSPAQAGGKAGAAAPSKVPSDDPDFPLALRRQHAGARRRGRAVLRRRVPAQVRRRARLRADRTAARRGGAGRDRAAGARLAPAREAPAATP